jgi:hypothetical protein
VGEVDGAAAPEEAAAVEPEPSAGNLQHEESTEVSTSSDQYSPAG